MYNYGFNGKELQQENGIAWHDFGSRNFDAELGRWMNIDPQAGRYVSVSPYMAMGNNPISFTDPNGEALVTSVIIGTVVGAVIGGASVAIANPKADFGDIFAGMAIGGFSGAITAGIGEGFSGLNATLTAAGKSTGWLAFAQAGSHAVFQGGLAAAQGGEFGQAAAVAAISSGVSSAIGNAGNKAIGMAVEDAFDIGTKEAFQAAEKTINALTTNVAVSQAASGAFIGGAISKINGGDFVEGFAMGLTVAGLNHSLHALAYSNNNLLTGNIKFENLTDNEFNNFRVIPEKSRDPLIKPSVNNKTYYGDGLYINPRNVPLHGNSDYWFKVSAGASLSVRSTKLGYRFNYSKSSTMQHVAKFLKKPYKVGFRPYSDGGSGLHGSFGSYRNPFHSYFPNN